MSDEALSSDGELILQFPFESFRVLRTLLEQAGGAREVGGILDMDWVQLEFNVQGALITLERDIWDGFTTVSAGSRGREVLTSLRGVLDTPDHPVLEEIG